MVRIIRFPASRPHIWLNDVSEYVVDGAGGWFRFRGPARTFRRISMPCTLRMVTYETCEDDETQDVQDMMVKLVEVEYGDEEPVHTWDAELGAYVMLAPVCSQTVRFHIVPTTNKQMEEYDVLPLGGCSDEEAADDDGIVLLE
jgi:hypothetical protein